MRLSNYTLTPTRINNAKAKARLYKLSDGGGLFVEVSTTGQKTWRYQYRFAGSRRDVKIGRYPEIGVADARARHFEVFRMLTKDGLVRHAPNRGVFVAVPTIASIIDIYRVRRLIECQALAQAYPHHPAKKKMREAVEDGLRCRAGRDWVGVGTANMAFHMAIVELADSERLNLLFAPVLAELRLAFGMLRDAEFLHAPYVDMNVKILELAEAGEFAGAAAELTNYLVHSERIVLAVYARHISEAGWGS